MNKTGTIIRTVITAVVTAACAGCGNSADTSPIPRRYAYPRIDIYNADYRTDTVANVRFRTNSGTLITRPDSMPGDKGIWFNIVYPRYHAVVHCTVTNVAADRIDAVIDNRSERMALNTGGSYTEITDFMPQHDGGFTAKMLVTPDGSVTPVQFLASDGMHTVVSGSMIFRTARHIDPDSVAPVISAVEADLTELLNSLSVK